MGFLGFGALKVGSWVEIRSAEEIFATLDPEGRLDGMPFMPEMLRFCGQRLRVHKIAHKTCDTVNHTGIRSVANAVHLDLRCDGAGHGGCQAACLLFWKTKWLRRVSGPVASASSPSQSIPPAIASALGRLAFRPESRGAVEDPSYQCQATDLPGFSNDLSPFDPRPYFQDVLKGNVSLRRALRAFAIMAFNKIQRWRHGSPYPDLWRRQWPTKTPTQVLGLQPGELVRIKSKNEILDTVDENLLNRGLSFDREMAPFCGREVQVKSRVERLLDERTGRMLTMTRDCIILDGVTCRGDLSDGRLLCPRGSYAYWREIWLERVPASGPSLAEPPAAGSGGPVA